MQKLIKAFENMMVAIHSLKLENMMRRASYRVRRKKAKNVLAAASEPLMVSKKS